MNLIKPSYEIMHLNADLELIERAGRLCYKSEGKICEGSAAPFVDKIIHTLHHESVIEHSLLTVKFTVDRGVSHELVRHRLASFSQESTRYCNYAKKGVTFIIPPWVDIEPGEYTYDAKRDARSRNRMDNDLGWYCAIAGAASEYETLLANGWTPQQARSVLPNSLKTEVVMSANFREWRHILKLRTSRAAHPQMQEIMRPLAIELQTKVPVIFDDVKWDVPATI